MSRTRVVCAGLVAADVLYFLKDHPAQGDKHRASGAQMIAGGGALNAAAAVAVLGGHALLAGAIGDDMFGGVIRQALARRAIDDALLITVPGVPSSHSAVLVTETGDRTVINHRDDRLFARAPQKTDFDALLVDTRWRAGAATLLPLARAAGKPAVVDAEAPFDGIADLLPCASHVAFSEQGLAAFTGATGAEGLATAAHRLQSWVCVTRGARPVLWHDGSQTGEVPVPQVPVRDTLGAGDVWHGAFALALGQGRTATDAIQQASLAASRKVQYTGHLRAEP